jgi:DNA mismatch repair protein MutS
MSAKDGPAALSPLMEQYTAIKSQHPDKLVFYRMGDFYELFGDDARDASAILGITLTSRGHGKGAERVPLAGVPHHSAEKYLAQLLAAGRKVVVCEQTEDPRLARGLVRRDVVEVLTPGTPTLGLSANEGPIVAIAERPERWGVALLEFATGRFLVCEDTAQRVQMWLLVVRPAEVLVSGKSGSGGPAVAGAQLTRVADASFRPAVATRLLAEQFGTRTLAGFGVADLELAVSAAGALLAYLRETKKTGLDHLTHIRRHNLDDRMFLDPDTVANLELVEARDTRHPETSLLHQVDRTVTAMGKRLLRQTLTAPFRNRPEIERRRAATAFYYRENLAASSLREELALLPDFERLAGRIGYGKANPRELVGLALGLQRLPVVRAQAAATDVPYLAGIAEAMPDLTDPARRILATLRDDPPVAINEGGLIRDGVDPELGALRSAIGDSKAYLANLQNAERLTTGIPSLRVGFNKVFGYYIEVTHAHKDRIPRHYVRKQTLVSAERYITDELKAHEDKVLHAEERIHALEEQIFLRLRDSLRAHTRELQAAAEAVAALDVACAWGELARDRRYTEPLLADDRRLVIEHGRHPVVEQVVAAGRFVPNDTAVDGETEQIQIITGPNMSGKSTYLRQVGLIVLLGQCGSFVPAARAEIGLVDRIFTRVGASDQLALGRSTFLVEMEETANILHHCTDRSLVLLDEIGRGTSTYDGLSVAWAVAEHLHEAEGRRARTLFATHYHELTALANLYPRIHNFQVAVKRYGDKVIFLHEIKPGGCDDSYGIAVARLAGLPAEVIARAQEILADLESGEFNPEKLRERHSAQFNLFAPPPDPLVSELSELDVNSLAPLDALNRLAELVARARLRLNRSA